MPKVQETLWIGATKNGQGDLPFEVPFRKSRDQSRGQARQNNLEVRSLWQTRHFRGIQSSLRPYRKIKPFQVALTDKLIEIR